MKVIDPDLYKTLMDILGKHYRGQVGGGRGSEQIDEQGPEQIAQHVPEQIAQHVPEQIAQQVPEQIVQQVTHQAPLQMCVCENIGGADALLDFDQLFNQAIRKIKRKALKRNKKRGPRRK